MSAPEEMKDWDRRIGLPDDISLDKDTIEGLKQQLLFYKNELTKANAALGANWVVIERQSDVLNRIAHNLKEINELYLSGGSAKKLNDLIVETLDKYEQTKGKG